MTNPKRISDLVSVSLYRVGHGKRTIRQRLFLAAHGNKATWACTAIPSFAFLVWVLTNDVKAEDILPISAYYNIMCTIPIYEVFFAINFKNLENTLKQLQVIVSNLEKDMNDKESKINESQSNIIHKLSQLVWYSCAVEGTFFSLQPVQDRNLPPVLQGTSFSQSPGRVFAQLVHSIGVLFMATVVAHFIEVQTSLILYLRCAFLILQERLLKSTEARGLRQLAEVHSNLLSVSGERNRIFRLWNSIYLVNLGMISVFTTVGVTGGLADPAMIGMVPFAFGVVFCFCLLGEITQQSSLTLFESSYKTQWYTSDTSYTKTLLLIMTRAGRATTMGAIFLGSLSLTIFIDFMKNYYRFVQILLKVK